MLKTTQLFRLVTGNMAKFPVGRLYTDESLGLCAFDKWCDEQKKLLPSSLGEFENTFLQTLSKLRKSENKSLIVSEDFKMAIACGNDCRLPPGSSNIKNPTTIYEICSQIDSQVKRWPIFSFPFGSFIMKLCHRLKMPDIAFQLLNDDNICLFDDLASYQLCMDLLYKSGQYSRIMDVWQRYRQRCVARDVVPYPRSMLILTFASLYHQNDQDALENAFHLYKEVMIDGGEKLPRRAVCFFCALCRRQNQLELAYELLSTINSEEFLLGRSLKSVLCYELGRLVELSQLLSRVILSDVAADCYEDNYLSVDVAIILKKLCTESESDEIRSTLAQQLKLLKQGNHIIRFNIEKLLDAPISIAPSMNSSFDPSEENKSLLVDSLRPTPASISASTPLDKNQDIVKHTSLNLINNSSRPLEHKKLNRRSLPISDQALIQPKHLAYENETVDVDDVHSFTSAERRFLRRRQLMTDIASKVARDGPYEP